MTKRIVALLAALAVFIGGVTAPAQAAAFSASKGFPGSSATKTVSTSAALTGPYFFYNVARQTGATADGMQGNLIISNPYLAPGDFHSLAELSVSSANSQNHVEVGYTKDASVCGSTGGVANVCLFVFRWTNGVPSCYNLCGSGGFVEYATWCATAGAVCAGDSVNAAVGLQKSFVIQHSGTVWWVAYDGNWIGYYPDTLWSGTFTQGGFFQGFGEVAANVPTPCTDMGNGLSGLSNVNAARVGSLALINGSAANNFTMNIQPVNSPTTVYDLSALSNRTMRYGGPGWNAAGTAVGTTGSC